MNNKLFGTNNYQHESGLLFDVSRLVAANGSDHDVSIIVLWLPNSADEPMIIIDYYFGDIDAQLTKECVDKWLADKQPSEIYDLMLAQDMTDEQHQMLIDSRK